MAFDRNPLLPIFADKYAVRNFVTERIGEKYLVDLIFETTDPLSLKDLKLPEEFVIKSNHGSGAMILVSNNAPASGKLPSKIPKNTWDKYLIHPSNFRVEESIEWAAKWLSQNFYYRPGYFPEWAYKSIRPRILVEKLLSGKDGNLPNDFKFFMVNGRCKFIQVDSSRFNSHSRDLYTPEWIKIIGTYKYPNSNHSQDKPYLLGNMLEVAEKLSHGIDFVRVDLYETDQGVKFGELTNYPEGGIGKFKPAILDEEFGEGWFPAY